MHRSTHWKPSRVFRMPMMIAAPIVSSCISFGLIMDELSTAAAVLVFHKNLLNSQWLLWINHKDLEPYSILNLLSGVQHRKNRFILHKVPGRWNASTWKAWESANIRFITILGQRVPRLYSLVNSKFKVTAGMQTWLQLFLNQRLYQWFFDIRSIRQICWGPKRLSRELQVLFIADIGQHHPGNSGPSLTLSVMVLPWSTEPLKFSIHQHSRKES